MTNKALTLNNDMTLSEIGTVLVKSGFFTDARDSSQAIVKIMAGRELGFGPIASMTGVYIVKGRVSLSANLMAAAVKRTTRYNYRVTEHTDKVCEIEFTEGGQPCGRSRFTDADAKKAGTQNMEKYPRNMLFARAMSNGVKWYCPDVFGGPIYTPEEMGASTNEDGEVIEHARPKADNGHEPEPVTNVVDATTGEIIPAQTEPANGSTLWKRWYAIVAEAQRVGVLAIPTLDDAADDGDIVAEGKALRAKITAANKQLAEDIFK
jgi:hypothetical protein